MGKLRGMAVVLFVVFAFHYSYAAMKDDAVGERRVPFDSENQRCPAISGNYIVWEDDRNGNSDIYLYDILTGEEKQIAFGSEYQGNPAISDSCIVWENKRNGNSDIYLYDISRPEDGEQRITFDTANQVSPAISGNYIVWEDDRNGNSDIYLYDISTGEEKQITFGSEYQGNPAISGNYIVWEDCRNGNSDIYLAVIDTTGPSKPIIEDDGDFAATTLNASWTSSDPETGIAEYRYCIMRDSILVKDWASTGTANSVSVSDLDLQDGKVYYFWVMAKNKAGLWSEAGCSDGIKADTILPTGRIAINDGVAYSISTGVILKLSAKDTGSGIGAGAQMRFSNDNEIWSDPKTYNIIWPWKLPSGNGKRTVYAQFRDNAGNWSEVVSDSITVRQLAMVFVKDITKPTGTIRINNDDEYTASASVTLTLSASDTVSGMVAGAQMRFSNNGVTWSDPVAYSTSKSWTLSSGSGTKKTVYAKFRDAAGNWSTAVISDSITKE